MNYNQIDHTQNNATFYRAFYTAVLASPAKWGIEYVL